ncbi:MAG TPA: trypsin-like peptidase domain-containing protein, partial [Acidimicrobiales bacterium]|nr:trypsin-like peptidase domain-containing protein [Acidimicrobiales bacterium]
MSDWPTDPAARPLDPGAAPSSPPHAWEPRPPYAGEQTSPQAFPPAPGMPPPPPAAQAGRSGLGPWRFVLAGLLVVALIVAGFALGTYVADDDPPIPEAAPASETAAEQREPDPAPLEGTGQEPIADVAATVAPTVVQIEVGQGVGSGFIYDEEGLILTAAHVVQGSSEVDVVLADGDRLEGEVLGADDGTDVAVIQIDPGDRDLPVAALATGVPVQVGQTAVAVGSPFGLDQTVTAGIVSAVDRSFPTADGVLQVIQTDTPINPGNSGGALADRQGRIIGINDAILTGGVSSGNVGVGFAIPIDTAVAAAAHLERGEEVEFGFLGVQSTSATGDDSGAQIVDVTPGSPADEAGIDEGDVIVQVGDD